MAFNPFLSMGEPAAAPTTDEVLNPFMMSEPEINAFAGDNPFATTTLPSSNSNPFSDFGGTYEPPAGDTVPVDIFGCAEPLGAKQFDGFTSEAPSAMDIFAVQPTVVKPTELDLSSTTTDNLYNHSNDINLVPHTTGHTLPPETQNLILNVTGQMEFTSCDLLDRIPPTRTPSPVSLRDIHSPSPTPEPLELPEEPAPPPENLDINRNKPTRPPPARPPPAARPPPPRPAPPPIPPFPSIPASVQQTSEDINLFAAPQPVVVKPTKEDILSLYSAPKKEEEKPIDFLSDDINEDVPVESANDEGDKISPYIVEQMNTYQSNFGENPTETITSNITISATPMDCSEPPAVVTPVISNSSPFSYIEENEAYQEMPNEFEKNPFGSENIADKAQPLAENITNVFGMTEDQFAAPISEVVTTAYNTMATSQDVQCTESQNIFSTAPSNMFDDSQDNIFASEKPDTFGADNTGVFGEDNADAFGQSNAFGDSNSDAFGSSQPDTAADLGWGASPETKVHSGFPESQDAFDAFSAQFDSASANRMNTAIWGEDETSAEGPAGFEAEAFDPFLSMNAPPPPTTPRLPHEGSQDSNDDNFSLFIRPKESASEDVSVPVLAPPPRPAALPDSPRANPFDKTAFDQHAQPLPEMEDQRRRSGSGGETPPTPLFDEDVSMPLEDFPRTKYNGPGWEMQLRQPNKKKITGQRFWKKIFVRLVYQGDNPAVQLFNAAGDKEPFQELPLQACYSVSEIAAQQFDQFGKIFTVKLQYVFYKERPGVRPGQVTKAERITNKISQFAAYAIQGDYQGVKEFGSDLRKLGLPVEHAPQVSQLFKLGSLDYEHVKQFSSCIEEALFRIPAHRDRALTYKMEEVQITAVDELYVEQDAEGSILKQIARVRLFFLGFLSGMPDIELGVNDLRRQGKEVVGRHDIIPVATEEWIRVEQPEFHACVAPEHFHDTQIIKFKPPDACYIELLRFRVRPPKNRELPLQLKAVWCVIGNKVELRADVLVPGFASRKLGQVPCEDVAIRFPIPESWIYLFRVEKHFRYGSVKSAHRRTGKIKGIERFLGAVDTLSESLIEVTSGQAKYEHQHRAIVWRMPRLPKEGQGAYTTHNLVSRMALTSYDQIPAELAKFAHVEFTMPATQVSHMTARSVSLQNHDNDPPEKYVRYLARHEYIVGIERTSGQSAPAYSVAASTDRAPPAPAPAPTPAVPEPPSSDSDSD